MRRPLKTEAAFFQADNGKGKGADPEYIRLGETVELPEPDPSLFVDTSTLEQAQALALALAKVFDP